MPTATLPMNGKPRKQLSDQLDRLDEIIDVLGDGLNEAIVTAMRTGARQAVKDALVDVLTHPEFLKTFQSAIPVPAQTVSPKPTLWSRLKAGAARIRNAAGTVVRWVGDRFRNALSAISEKVGNARDRGKAILAVAHSGGIYLRRLTLTATLVGVLTALAAYASPHELLVVTGAVGSAAIAAVAQVVYRARNVIRSLMVLSFPSPAVMPV